MKSRGEKKKKVPGNGFNGMERNEDNGAKGHLRVRNRHSI